MAAKKSTINAFESELAIALKSASITAAASVIENNPNMTLEDFYGILQPQGVTENITLGEIVGALSGEEVVVAPVPSATKKPRPKHEVAPGPAKQKKPRKPSKLPTVNCMTKVGQEAYHRAILEYLTAVDDWVRSPDIMTYCGGDKSQVGTAMRKHLIPSGLVKSKGKTYGLHFAITSKGKRKAASGSAVTSSQAAPAKASGGYRRQNVNGIGNSSRTIAARDAYRAVVLKYMHGNAWRSGPEISAACGGNPSRRKLVIKNLIAERLVEHNGKATGAARWRLARK